MVINFDIGCWDAADFDTTNLIFGNNLFCDDVRAIVDTTSRLS